MYKHAATTGETVTLDNGSMRLVMYKRLSGWGYGEIYTKEGKLMAILEHLGELLVRDQEIPMRLEADTYELVEVEESYSLVFDVKSMNVQGMLDGTSFAPWMYYPFDKTCLSGRVVFRMDKKEPVVKMESYLTAGVNMYVKYIRGPWLKVGEGTFGVDKTDGIFPGVEWLIDREWSSGSDWFREPWYNKVAPHPNKVSIPCMTVSHEGDAIGLSWNPNKWATRWFNYRVHYPQPVYAVPNFVDRMDNSLMGLMLPCASCEIDENQVYAEYPLEMHLHQIVRFESEIFLTKGNSLDAVVDWVKRHGLIDVNDSRDYYITQLVKMANRYNTNLWHDEKGFGVAQRNGFSFYVPNVVRWYVEEYPEEKLAKDLKEKIKVCEDKQEARQRGERDWNERGKLILSWQKEDGSFRFEPDGRHKSKDDFIVAREFCAPMGQAYDTALDICVVPALELIDIYRKTSNKIYYEAAKAALDFCDDFTRPEGGDFWETPLHAPNLYAAGHAAIAFYEFYRESGERYYLDKAIYWIRSILPFTHLWEPENMPMKYNTKPCLCSSDWYFANWVRDHVQWEVLSVFADSSSRGIDWAEIDKEIDWFKFQRGITCAALRWIIDHREEKWMPHNIPSTYEQYVQGLFDGCFPDTHNCVTGNYGGMVIRPDSIAANIFAILRKL
ncbi:MAG: hypothetical protein ACOX3J_04290 [Clostridia bacterium]|jgi:hypothetical protein